MQQRGQRSRWRSQKCTSANEVADEGNHVMVLWSGVDSVKVKMGQSRTESKNQESGFISQHALLTVPSFLSFPFDFFFVKFAFLINNYYFFPPIVSHLRRVSC